MAFRVLLPPALKRGSKIGIAVGDTEETSPPAPDSKATEKAYGKNAYEQANTATEGSTQRCSPAIVGTLFWGKENNRAPPL